MLKIKLTFLLSFVLLLSCDGDDSDDPGGYSCGETSTNFRITGIDSYNMKIDQGFDFNGVQELDTLDFNNFSIFFQFERDFFTERSAKNLKQEQVGLSCSESGYKGDIIGIDTLYVKTKFNYNNFVAGDTINSLVQFTEYGGLKSLSEYIDENKNGVLFDSFELRLSEEPLLSNTSFALDVSYILNNGEEFNVTTETIILE